MRQRFDLTAAQAVDRDGSVLGFAELTDLGRHPAQAVRELLGTRRDELVLIEDDVPKSAKGAAAALIACCLPARRRTLETAGGTRELGAAAMLARKLPELLLAIARETWATLRLRRAVKAALGARAEPPERAAATARALYLRGNPRLAWRGAQVGGALTHMAGVVNGLRDNGVDVSVLAPRPVEQVGSGVHQVPPRMILHFEPWLTRVAYGQELERAAAGLAVDFVYQRYDASALSGLRLARAKRVPLVLEYNGSELWTAEHWGTRNRPERGLDLQRRVEQHVLEQASLVVVVSDPLREQLVERGISAERILLNPNGVDVERMAPLRRREPTEWRRRAGIPDAPTIGFIGTFGLWHGVLQIPEIVERVAAEAPAARWVLIGDGLLHRRVEEGLRARGVSDRVLLAGSRPHEEALELLAASDVCVSPHAPNPDGSRFFGSPTKLFEYMGLAKPIVASDLEQIGEVLDDRRTALLHEPENGAAAASAVIELLRDPALRAELGRAALAEAEAEHTWRAHVGRILERIAPDGG